jgi:hypothetical protein
MGYPFSDARTAWLANVLTGNLTGEICDFGVPIDELKARNACAAAPFGEIPYAN